MEHGVLRAPHTSGESGIIDGIFDNSPADENWTLGDGLDQLSALKLPLEWLSVFQGPGLRLPGGLHSVLRFLHPNHSVYDHFLGLAHFLEVDRGFVHLLEPQLRALNRQDVSGHCWYVENTVVESTRLLTFCLDIQLPSTDAPIKEPVVNVAELNSGSSTEGSDSGHTRKTLQEAPIDDARTEVDGDSVSDFDTTQRRISRYSQNSELVFDEPDEKHNPKSIDPDLTIDTVLDGEVPTLRPLASRRAVSSGLFSNGDEHHGFDHSFAKSEDGLPPGAIAQGKINNPKRRIRIDSLGPPSPARRTISSETTMTNLGRRASNMPKNLPIEERIVKTHACLKELLSPRACHRSSYMSLYPR